MTPTLRPMRVSERAMVVGLGTEVFAEFGDYERVLREWTENPAMQTLIAPDAQGRSLGFATVALTRTGSNSNAVRAHLLAIGVAPAGRLKGLGGRLLDAALDLARREGLAHGATELRLQVAEDNRGARALFASRGFVVVPGVAVAYEGGRSALTLVVSL